MTDMENMFGLMDTKSKVTDEKDAKPLDFKEGKIEFKNVSFSYDTKRGILNDVSFTINPGETIGIVGPSGSGKSTILRLLFRFFNPSQGEILIDGQPINKVTLESLRKVIGVVPQDTVLFNDSLKYNIRYGNLEASDKDIDEAVDRSELRSLLNRLPDGYDTQVGERGLMLSGGEKQRVSLARTILKRPKILLCDESTSSLDTESERKIMNSIKELSHGCTSLLIAHRLSTVKTADKIIVLGYNGNVEEIGTHQELLQNQEGIY
eukprot:CAMPEP_0117421802 /NCGR_PEP_ID=MMETSP0758-20121206/2786_1 /TAXON_ID=63605 /ORGANISM="Percolomonas cosmopolitus, Strain AE-1 (ATCC 50343)" /LENGTH=263 /DNA_ID=CAMNT_0005204075 /DNA_START=1382 /DNA_END=2170 /DNA_ORIENTATION=-